MNSNTTYYYLPEGPLKLLMMFARRGYLWGESYGDRAHEHDININEGFTDVTPTLDDVIQAQMAAGYGADEIWDDSANWPPRLVEDPSTDNVWPLSGEEPSDPVLYSRALEFAWVVGAIYKLALFQTCVTSCKQSLQGRPPND